MARMKIEQHNQPEISCEIVGWGGVDWIDLAMDRDQWRALVNTVINIQVP
jgi:hypothetical protein